MSNSGMIFSRFRSSPRKQTWVTLLFQICQDCPWLFFKTLRTSELSQIRTLSDCWTLQKALNNVVQWFERKYYWYLNLHPNFGVRTMMSFKRIESIQKKFIKYALRNLGLVMFDPLKLLKLSPHIDRNRKFLSLKLRSRECRIIQTIDLIKNFVPQSSTR